MTSEQFCYWLQGFVEMNPNAMLTHTQWLIIKDHLALVMNKQTPNRPYVAPVIGPEIVSPLPPSPLYDPFPGYRTPPIGIGEPYKVMC